VGRGKRGCKTLKQEVKKRVRIGTGVIGINEGKLRVFQGYMTTGGADDPLPILLITTEPAAQAPLLKLCGQVSRGDSGKIFLTGNNTPTLRLSCEARESQKMKLNTSAKEQTTRQK